MSGLTVRTLFEGRRDELELNLLAGAEGLDRPIASPDISSPGLVLSGYTERFPANRMQVLGETEISYLITLEPADRRTAVSAFAEFEVPCVFITKDLDVPGELSDLCESNGIPLIRSSLKTGEFFRWIKPFLEDEFAPTTSMHASLADVYGVGLLFVGQSGIGKSECVLDLVERGHRLVADDVVMVRRRGVDVLIGRGHELQRHHMEIRGIGIVDVAALFGIRSTRQQKRIEVVVQLESWQDDAAYDRTGLETESTEILGVEIPRVLIPLNPGKNLTVLSEVVAMRHLLKYSGVDSAKLFEQQLLQAMQPVRHYLEEDNE
ncbi:MAG: HPr(Ser) kinase/phosphatase [Gemmatimonadota bacterium]